MSREIVDTHVHYWEPDLPERPWDRDGVVTGPPLSVERLLDDAARAGVTKVVQVTPSIMGFDNRYGVEGARRFPDRIVGVIGRFDPVAPEMPQRLAAYLDEPAMLGIRLTLIKRWTEWLADGTLDPFLDEAGRRNVTVQIYAPHQAPWLLAAARRHPRTRFLIDHMTLSHGDAQPFAQWSDVLALADAPNVWMKASYFPEVAHEPYPFASVRDRFAQLFDRFGPDRLIWGSNYPPSRDAASYKESVDFVDTLPFLDESAKRNLFAENFFRALGAG